MESSLSRRDLLRAGAASAALGASAIASESLAARAFAAAKPKPGAKLGDIEHVIVLMQENRSFDEYFGTYPGVRGFGDKVNAKAFRQPGYTGPGSVDGKLLPFHLQGKKPVGQCVADPTHNWEPQHQSWNNGKNDRFYEIHSRPEWDGAAGPTIMGFYGQQDIPYHWALAKAYTVCDMYFCSVIGPTSPNRCYSVSASLGEDGKKGGPCLSTAFDVNGIKGDFQWTTMPEQLQARKISWKSYTEAIGQFDNVFPAFRQFRNNSKLNSLGIKPTYPNDFTTDLKNDELPAVSWVQLSFLDSEHAANPPGKGEAAIDRFLRLLWKYPKVWKKTAVIINYDENGGFFDHVAPPVAPKGTKGEYLTMSTLPPQAGGIRGPIGLGFRVPCTIVSPWTRGGFVSSDVFDHTSVLKLIEKRFGAEVPNLSSWRRKTVGDMTSAFNFAAKPDFSIPDLPATSGTSPDVTTDQCGPEVAGDPPPYPVPSSITFPKQKSGKAKRPSGIV